MNQQAAVTVDAKVVSMISELTAFSAKCVLDDHFIEYPSTLDFDDAPGFRSRVRRSYMAGDIDGSQIVMAWESQEQAVAA